MSDAAAEGLECASTTSTSRESTKIAALLLVSAAVLLAAEQPSDEASKKDLEKLQGDWVAVSIIRDGEKYADDEAQALFRTIKGNEYTVARFDKALGGGTFTLDATKKPKTIDVTPLTPKGKAPLVLYVAVAVLAQATMSVWAAYVPHNAPAWLSALAARLACTGSPTMLALAHHDVHHARPEIPCRHLGRGAAHAPEAAPGPAW